MRVAVRYRFLRRRLNILNHNYTSYILPILIFILTTSLLYILYSLHKFNTFWLTWDIALGNAHYFCEADRAESVVRQPANTWSNLGFLISGLIILTLGINDMYRERNSTFNLIVKYPVFSIMLGISTLYVFFGSFFYHASLTYFFQKMDITGIYAMMLTILAYNINVLFPTIKHKGSHFSSHHLIVAMTILIFLAFYFYIWKVNINVLFPSMVGLTFIVKYFVVKFKRHKESFDNYFIVGVVSILIAGVIWFLDIKEVICSPDSALQGHAVWHILCALSAFSMYLFYRTNNTLSIAADEVDQ